MTNKFWLYICFLFFLHSCSAQVFTDYTLKEIEESVWVPATDDYRQIKFDNNVMLVFQEEFNDSIKIYVEDSLLFSKFYKTNQSLSVVPIFDKIEKDFCRKGKDIRILLPNKKEYVTFEIKPNYAYAYITRNEYGEWFVEFSEYQRKYY